MAAVLAARAEYWCVRERAVGPMRSVCTIPKSVFETAPEQPSSGSGAAPTVRRLDGTIAEVPAMTPDNPNFAPRCAWPGGNIVTTNKDEALLKYYQRKGIPLPEHLQQKARELESESAAQKALAEKRKKRFGGQGGVKVLSGMEGAMTVDPEEEERRKKRMARFGATSAGGSVEAPPPKRVRPKPPPPKVLSGAEGGVKSQ